MMISKTEHNFQYKIITPQFQMHMKLLVKIFITHTMYRAYCTLNYHIYIQIQMLEGVPSKYK